ATRHSPPVPPHGPTGCRSSSRRWSGTGRFAVGRPYGDATEALVAEATLLDGTPAVLKLLLGPAEAARPELTVLRLVGGDGCARLLRADDARGALLLERSAGHSRSSAPWSGARRSSPRWRRASGGRRRSAGCRPAPRRQDGLQVTSPRPGRSSAVRARRAR